MVTDVISSVDVKIRRPKILIIMEGVMSEEEVMKQVEKHGIEFKELVPQIIAIVCAIVRIIQLLMERR